ncbi:MAG: helix-turn-helix transcriptional regulator [Lachnospiraceae bacterium]|nr:helix-turn-helix transcriptional regulator [Lachnospiraceae bacterium]
MSFGENIQFLRKMHRGMTQEELAEKMSVSRQTVSKWELDNAFPEMEKAIALCKLFSCTLDELITGNLNDYSDQYLNLHIETVPAFRYFQHTVISTEPEEDAMSHIQKWTDLKQIHSPVIIGWDFPYISQEQINVYHMHGYVAACILPDQYKSECDRIQDQASQNYAVITIKDPFKNPFHSIPNAYKTLMRYIDVNQFVHKELKDVISCFEKAYVKDGTSFMDVYISIAS